jgi:hypothetical protein
MRGTHQRFERVDLSGRIRPLRRLVEDSNLEPVS